MKIPEVKYDTFLVTGGAGFIGSHICEELFKQGKRVKVIDNLVANALRPDTQPWWNDELGTFCMLNVSDYDSPIRGIKSSFDNIDVVFHNAASKCTVCMEHPDIDMMTNGLGTLNVCRASVAAGVKKVIYASTGSVMDGTPHSYYGISKLSGENYVKAIKRMNVDFNYTILRYFNVYGTRQPGGDKGGVVPNFILRMLAGMPLNITGNGDQIRHFTTVNDIVAANFHAANGCFSNTTANVVSDVDVTINELAANIASYNPDIEIRHIPDRPDDIKHFIVKQKHFQSLGGYNFDNDWKQNISELVEWYMNNCTFNVVI